MVIAKISVYLFAIFLAINFLLTKTIVSTRSILLELISVLLQFTWITSS